MLPPVPKLTVGVPMEDLSHALGFSYIGDGLRRGVRLGGYSKGRLRGTWSTLNPRRGRANRHSRATGVGLRARSS